MPLRYALISLLLSTGCAGTLPDAVYANQLDAYFPASAPSSAGAAATDAERTTRIDAERCAARLNHHRSQAELATILQAIFSSVGGAASAAGGALSAIDFGNRDVTTAMGVLSAAGAGVTLIGNLVIGLVANPLEELRLHANGMRSWNVAVELHYGNGDVAAIDEALTRCAADQAPPLRVVGTPPVFSR